MQDVFNTIRTKIHSPMGVQYAFIVTSGLALFAHIAFVVPALYFLARVHPKIDGSQVEAWLQKHCRLVIWIPALLVILMFVVRRPAPLDDLLAITAIASGTFSHDSFAFSRWGNLPASPWYGFEILLSRVTPYLGQDITIMVIQALSVLLTSVSITLAVRGRMHGRTDLVLPALVLIGLAMASMAIGRAYNGRIESFFFAWAIAAFWMPARFWLAAGIVMTPLYWLSWIYVPAALLLKAPLFHRVIIASILFVATAITWDLIAGGHYMAMFAMTSQWLAERQGMIGENVPLLTGLAGSSAALFLMIAGALLAIYGKGHRKEWPLILVAVWFAIPDMIRYLPLIATVIAVWIMGVRARNQRQFPPAVILLAAFFPMAIAFSSALPSSGMSTLPKFNIPPGSVVVGALNHGLYASILHNPGIRPSPAFEIGSTDIEIQKAVKALQSKGEFDCSLLRFYQIDYVLDNRLTHIPPCLRLDQVHGSWRLWKTIRQREV